MSALITCKFFIIPPLETIPKSPLRKSFSLVWCDKWLIIWYWPLKVPAKYLAKLLPFPIDVHSYPAKSKSLSRYIVFPLKDSLTVLSLTNFAIPASCFAVTFIPIDVFAINTVDKWDGTVDTSWYDTDH